MGAKDETTDIDPALALESAEVARYEIINETIRQGGSNIQQFYAGAVVFITGGSGFLGKQLIEKLLRSCDIKKIYMLLRTKKGESVERRLEKFVKDPVFDKLYEIKPDFPKIIFPIFGDITEVSLGISEQSWTTLKNEVTIIFHGAATISFTEPLKVATLTNVRGSREMLVLGKACKNLKAFVHISTAYSHATKERINKQVLEKFYDSPISPAALIQLVETLDERIIDDMTPEWNIKSLVVAYLVSLLELRSPIRLPGVEVMANLALMGEAYVQQFSGRLPAEMINVAFLCALREPSPGWLDSSSIFGPTGYLYGLGLGVLHVVYADLNNSLDFVAVDLVNNAVIAAAKETADRHNKLDERKIDIYTVTGCRNPICFGELMEILYYNGPISPKSFGYIFSIVTRYKLIFLLIHWLLHVIPAHLADLVLRALGKRPKAVKLCSLITTFSNVYEYFFFNKWMFGDENLRQLYFKMSSADRIIFECNMANLHWPIYLPLWWVGGVRRRILKDDLKNSLAARRTQIWLGLVYSIILPTYFYVIFKILYSTVFFTYIIVFTTVNTFVSL